MGPLIIEPVWCVTRPKRSTSTSCRCPATFMPVEALWRWLREDVTYHSAIPPPRISAAGWPLSKHASIRTPSLTDSGSKITSTPTKKNYASQGRRGLVAWIAARLGRRPTLEEVAAARFAQQQREKRRALRAERRHLQWQRASRDDGKSPDAHVRAILAGPEMAAFWAAAAWLAGTLPGILASARPYDEWATRPETVLRLAE